MPSQTGKSEYKIRHYFTFTNNTPGFVYK